MTTPDLLAENLRLQAELDTAIAERDAAEHYKAGLVEQLGYVRDYLGDLIADLTRPVPADAPAACRDGDHITVAELPGQCALCGTQVTDGPDRPSAG